MLCAFLGANSSHVLKKKYGTYLGTDTIQQWQKRGEESRVLLPIAGIKCLQSPAPYFKKKKKKNREKTVHGITSAKVDIALLHGTFAV